MLRKWNLSQGLLRIQIYAAVVVVVSVVVVDVDDDDDEINWYLTLASGSNSDMVTNQAQFQV